VLLGFVFQMLSKKDRSSCDKMADLFAESNNRQKLRDYMGSIKLPCLPYLGILRKTATVFMEVCNTKKVITNVTEHAVSHWL
jgi:Ras-specific guanine nucleotide-releasing factor RalGPS